MSISVDPRTASNVPPAVTPSPTTEILMRIDDGLSRPVLVYGSLPPQGSDIDLLVQPRDLAAVRATLMSAGFVENHGKYARFLPGKVEVVECAPTTAWRLGEAAIAALFQEAQPLLGLRHLVCPSPHHALLIRARKAAHRRELTPHQRASIRAAQDADPRVWEHAWEQADLWHGRHALALLRGAYDQAGSVSPLARWYARVERYPGASIAIGVAWWLRARLRWLAPPRIVSFSGIDGAGKSMQAKRLRDMLIATGQDAVVVWKGIGRNRLLYGVKKALRVSLRALPHGRQITAALDTVMPDISGPEAGPATLLRLADARDRGLAFVVGVYAWASLIALTNVLAVHWSTLRAWRRGAVLIYDRYTLDSVVRMLYWYGDTRATRFLVGLIHVATPRPRASFLLDLPAEVAFERKGEWGIVDLSERGALYADEYARLGVHRLDATQPPDNLSVQVASLVWHALSR